MDGFRGLYANWSKSEITHMWSHGHVEPYKTKTTHRLKDMENRWVFAGGHDKVKMCRGLR